MFWFPPLDEDYASAIGGLLFAISRRFAGVREFRHSRAGGNDRMKSMLSDA
jgi:hypothetical protein